MVSDVFNLHPYSKATDDKLSGDIEAESAERKKGLEEQLVTVRESLRTETEERKSDVEALRGEHTQVSEHVDTLEEELKTALAAVRRCKLTVCV